ncbi:MAG: histidinol dehydrogenase, partial [Candidatus Margulisbacteria bacterium]|nr:histidinol dehydrogenase [Candidatus Margulisiibacteriota bacterium]
MITIYTEVFSSLIKKLHADSRPDVTNDIQATVSEIGLKVSQEGDGALYHFSRKFDKVSDSFTMAVSEDELSEALKCVSHDVQDALQLAIDNISAYHTYLKPKDWK